MAKQQPIKPIALKSGPKPKTGGVKPIAPEEVADKKAEAMPDAVMEAFNELIAKNWDGYSASFRQDEVVYLIVQKLALEDAGPVYGNLWLDVEPIYRKNGWEVEYDKPDYTESYPATFKFSKKKLE